MQKPVEEVALDEETFSPANRQLKGFRLLGDEYVETMWKDMLLRVVKMIAERYPDVVDSLYDKGHYFWTSKTANMRYCTQIGIDKYLWTTMQNTSKLECLRYLFEKCDIAESELVMLLEPIKE